MTCLDNNHIKNTHFNQQIEERLIEIGNQHSKTDKEQLATKYARTLLEAIFNVFSMAGENKFLLFPNNFTNLPNLHVNIYLLQYARNFATLVNTAVGVKEMVHRIFKGMVSHMNSKVVELNLTWGYNTVQALQYLIDGWTDFCFNAETNMLNNLTINLKLYTIILGWYITESPNTTFTNIQNDEDIIFTICHVENFIDISLNNQWNAKKVRSKDLLKKLDENHPYFQDLYRAYDDYLNSRTAILNNSLTFYNSIAYTVFKSNQEPI
ncbi:hypothetical protein C1645_832989 [Glomus cerebriforme]|uniref:Uncharacterized protein n=1 Tax=Glomus cerebriforme TaxID=658196 RepID=A0A397SCE7_9GLOM|nr:hypothetical protein C1645_832989 [Glomus cerebriforme]